MELQQWLIVILEEYKSLRTESLTSMQNQQSILRFGITALGVLLGLAFTVEDLTDRFAILTLLIPALSLVFFLIYGIEFGRMVRVGRYIENIERRINMKIKHFNNLKEPLGWEQWLEFRVDNQTPRLPFYYSVPGMLLAPAVFSNIMACLHSPFCLQITLRWSISSAVICIIAIAIISLRLMSLRKSYGKFLPDDDS